jgi:NTE family protein
MRTPDVLVLGGGGILGEAWMSAVLAGLDESDRFDSRDCGSYIGTSAGSIVAALLAAGIDPRSRLGRMPEQPPAGEAQAALAPAARALQAATAAGGVAAGPMAWAALRLSEPAGRLARRVALGRVPRGRRSLAGLGGEIERAGATWDGRLRVAVVELESGRRIIFDGTEDPPVSVAEAVQASCAIPGVFRPLSVDGASYVDGGVWSPTNIDVAEVKQGSRVLCLNPTGSMRSPTATPVAAIAAVSRGAAQLEAAALRRRRASVRVISPDRDSAEAMGGQLMNPANRDQVIAAGLAQGRRLAGSTVAR